MYYGINWMHYLGRTEFYWLPSNCPILRAYVASPVFSQPVSGLKAKTGTFTALRGTLCTTVVAISLSLWAFFCFLYASKYVILTLWVESGDSLLTLERVQRDERDSSILCIVCTGEWLYRWDPLSKMISGLIGGQPIAWGFLRQAPPNRMEPWLAGRGCIIFECHQPVFCCRACRSNSCSVARSTIFLRFCTSALCVFYNKNTVFPSWHHDIFPHRIQRPWSWFSRPWT